MNIKKGIILAGGLGTRLKPLTDTIPKSMIEVQGKPLLEHIIELFKKFGVTEIYLSVGYLKEKIMEYFGNGGKFGVTINYITEDAPLGTAGPVKKGAAGWEEDFFVSNGDELKDFNLEEMYELHKRNKAWVTIALTEVEDPSAYGVVRMEGEKIVEFVSKPKKEEAPSHLINSGLYIFNPAVLGHIPNGFVMSEKEVFPKLAKEGHVFGWKATGQWFDTGTPERYETAKKEWKGLS